ncbi:hypothetical protein SAMN06273572_10420 [Monaibacterium marinum]|uniref:Uncharacterized protein n=1 Tax=Pontivivens marinum TaxID=1690039 RepID=A0A2C9CST9_9RHOB|nr:hypothetical protein SAMN06273572_10420 [Monaibacterium marinum]
MVRIATKLKGVVLRPFVRLTLYYDIHFKTRNMPVPAGGIGCAVDLISVPTIGSCLPWTCQGGRFQEHFAFLCVFEAHTSERRSAKEGTS